MRTMPIKKRETWYITVWGQILLTCVFCVLLFSDVSCSDKPDADPPTTSTNVGTSVHNADAGNVVATVNGEPVTVPEFRRFMLKNRSRVFSYFARKYGETEQKGFWNRTIGGETPIDRLRRIAMDECVRVKVQQIYAREKGVIDKISYAAFLEQLKKENQRRKDAVAHGKVIYGPVEYSETAGFDYWLSLIGIEMKRRFANDDLVIDDTVLHKLYDAEKELYKRPDTVTVNILTADGVGEKLGRTELERLAAGRRDSERLVDLYRRAADFVKFETRVFGDPAEGGDEDTADLADAARKLAVGEISPVVSHELGYSLLECTDRQDAGYYSFDEMKNYVRSRYIDKKFNQRIDSLVRNARVSIKPEVYNTVEVR
ncbi:MAG: peptidyl-prolyl cis-trans isomerase [Candidatus Hydrogenedentes bacterium]|nr:peptidyl-prolyl cis-trans isomerase [Candidatus Hydrogenedentota bacterium]